VHESTLRQQMRARGLSTARASRLAALTEEQVRKHVALEGPGLAALCRKMGGSKSARRRQLDRLGLAHEVVRPGRPASAPEPFSLSRRNRPAPPVSWHPLGLATTAGVGFSGPEAENIAVLLQRAHDDTGTT
jgi:hypothetical protein